MKSKFGEASDPGSEKVLSGMLHGAVPQGSAAVTATLFITAPLKRAVGDPDRSGVVGGEHEFRW